MEWNEKDLSNFAALSSAMIYTSTEPLKHEKGD
jgi:hypothetical protein